MQGQLGGYSSDCRVAPVLLAMVQSDVASCGYALMLPKVGDNDAAMFTAQWSSDDCVVVSHYYLFDSGRTCTTFPLPQVAHGP